MRGLNNLSIKAKIISATSVLVAIALIVGSFGLRQLGLVNEKALDVRENWLPSVGRLGELNGKVRTVRARSNGFALMVALRDPGVDAARTLLTNAIAGADEAFAKYKPLITPNTDDERLMAEFVALWDKTKALLAKGIELAKTDATGAIQALNTESFQLFEDVTRILAADVAFNEDSGKKAADAGKAVYDSAFTLILISLGTAMAAGIGIAALLINSVVAPLSRFTTTVGHLAGGNMDVRIEDTDRGDQIGILARGLEAFRTGLAERARQEKIAEEERLKSEEARRRAAEAEAIEREREMVSQSIGAGMAKLAAKDLTYRLNEQLPDAYAKLQSDFNSALDQLEAALKDIQEGTVTIASGAQEISAASGDLSGRTEQQAASLEESVAALGEVTETVKKTADGAKEARQVVEAAKSNAEAGGVVVGRAVDAMSRIEKSSQQISQIIGVIDEIAFQTNLLALNAGVEAARAGDAGRGFAVVASEVRALAQRSAEAAKEIKGLISTSASEVGEGVKLVAETGKSLERIVDMVTQINVVVSDIAAGTEEQANSLLQVNAAVNEMDKVTQQNAAMAEEATAASQSLALEGNNLAQLVSSFQVRGGRDLSGIELKPAARAAQRSSPRPAKVSTRAGAHASRGGRAQSDFARPAAPAGRPEPRRMAAGGTAKDDWTEF